MEKTISGEFSPRSRPFLTTDQREALDAALAEKQGNSRTPAVSLSPVPDVEKLQSQGRWMVHRRSHSREYSEKHERRSKSGKGLGGSKKGGAGGKYTWGPLLEDTGVAVLDKSDPNYDSEEEQQDAFKGSHKIIQEVEEYKQRVASIITEYYDNGDINEAATLLDDLRRPHFAQYFVKKAITMAMDRRDREREMTSYLLSCLYNEVIYPEQMRKGFEAVIHSVDDLKLDVPEAPELIALFLARAVVDDILPPAMIDKIEDREGSAICDVRQKASVHLCARHCTERMLRCWGAGAGLHYQDTKNSIAEMLYEYTSSHDIDETRRLLRNLDLPFFHHEFVKQAVHMAMENLMHRGAFLEMLVTLFKTGDISEGQMLKGFQRVAMRLEDTILDNPSAQEQFTAVVQAALAEQIIDQDDKQLAKEGGHSEAGSGGPPQHPHSIQSFKQATLAAILEYFESSDMDEVAERILELEDPGLHHIFVKHSIQKAMDRRDREREMISNLLSFLYPQVLSGDQLGQGFTRLLLSAEDLVLDNPETVHFLTSFLGRIIIDEVLPPSFLTSVLGSLKDHSLGVQIVKETGLLLSSRHAAERLLNCWHGGSKDIEQIRQEIQTMLKEFLGSKDVKEISRCLHELAVPFYHHEFVRRGLELALDSDINLEGMRTLFSAFSARGEISETQMKKGFDRMEALVDDLALDYPHAKERFSKIKHCAIEGGWMEPKQAN